MSWGSITAGDIVSGGGVLTIGQKLWDRDRGLLEMGGTLDYPKYTHATAPYTAWETAPTGNNGGAAKIRFPDQLEDASTFFMWIYVGVVIDQLPAITVRGRVNVTGIGTGSTGSASVTAATGNRPVYSSLTVNAANAGNWYEVSVDVQSASSGDQVTIGGRSAVQNLGWILP